MPPRHKRSLLRIVGLSVLVALAAAVLTVTRVSLLPPKLEKRHLEVGVAATHVVLDSPIRTTISPTVFPQHADGLAKRADVMSEMLASPAVLHYVGRRAHIPADQIGALSRGTQAVPLALSEPGSEERASELAGSRKPYRLEIQARRAAPLLDIYAQGPSVASAERLANGAVDGLRDYLRVTAAHDPERAAAFPVLTQQGRARGAVANSGAGASMALLSFIVVFAVALLAGLFATRRPRAPVAEEPEEDDAWPHTTRLLPWMLAVFMALLWLLPFNDIQLAASLPIDLKLDRLVLPFIAALWVFALVAGGRSAPRIRATPIHAAVGAFLVWAFVSVVVNAQQLNHTLELDQAIKRLPLLLAYASLFFMTSSIVRRNEVRAFLKYTLGLAAVCALGVVWEYRFKQNLFYDLSDKLLPGSFSVGQADAAGVDIIGRRVVRGPGAVPLEVVAMLAMALPIAIVGAIQADHRRQRILNGLAVCLLLAAMVATYRKSALLVPFSVIVTLAYFRRRELLRLAPLGLVALAIIHAISPAALGSTLTQLDPSRLGVATVSERTADYDAVRPDVLGHLVFGRGWGTYDHVTYRILDSEILQRIIETGVIGLIIYLLMAVSVVAAARGTIASRDPRWAPVALVGAAAAVAFAVASTLFDVMSFPHVPYIFLYLAGFVAVVARPGSAEERSAEKSTTHPHHSANATNASARARTRPVLPGITRV
jgi:hypothetical protein